MILLLHVIMTTILKKSNYCEQLAQNIVLVKEGDLDIIVENFKKTCDMLMMEEIHFRRHGTYRLSTEEQANDEVYSNVELMKSYLDGLLLSHIFWDNHFQTYKYYLENFLIKFSQNDRIMEIGPGHGFYLAAACKQNIQVTGIDISEASISHTRNALKTLAPEQMDDTHLIYGDIYELDEENQYDGIVASEILEHIEAPQAILSKLAKHLKKEGFIFVNIPICSPAPDHIYLFKHANEIIRLIEECNLEIDDYKCFPMNGYSVERAEKSLATINFVAICKRKAYK